jgi:mannosylglycoprotein endo-beta-mannosidase
MIARQGRLILIKTVVTAKSIQQMLIAEAPAWVLEEINKWQRAFFWVAKEKVNGGQCLVAWSKVCTPYEFGGLGVKDLRLQGLALRVRWEWLRRTDLWRPWQGLPRWKDSMAAEVFASLVKIKVGKGDKVLFWLDRWLEGSCILDIAPEVWNAVSLRRRNKRTVQEALVNDRWTRDILGELSPEGFLQYVQLSIAILNVDRDQEEQDLFSWPCDASGVFSASSTYKRLCEGGIRYSTADCIWKPWAPGKCKIFQWLAVQSRLWTTERRAKHGLQDSPNVCFTCLQEIDLVNHILLHCSYAKEVWFSSLRNANLPDVTPENEASLEDWWLNARTRVLERDRKAFDARVMLTCWSLWKQRNARAFNNVSRQCSAAELTRRIKDELVLWMLARQGCNLGRSANLLGE